MGDREGMYIGWFCLGMSRKIGLTCIIAAIPVAAIFGGIESVLFIVRKGAWADIGVDIGCFLCAACINAQPRHLGTVVVWIVIVTIFFCV